MNHIVKKSISIQAEPAKVWDALTNPEKTRKYFFNSRVNSTWKEGSEIRFEGRLFLIWKFEMKGKILGIAKNKFLQYTLHNESDQSGTQSVVTDLLEYRDGFTTLNITDDVGNGKGAQKRFERSQKGWDKILKGLKKVAEAS